jgi:hypothetical protein
MEERVNKLLKALEEFLDYVDMSHGKDWITIEKCFTCELPAYYLLHIGYAILSTDQSVYMRVTDDGSGLYIKLL